MNSLFKNNQSRQGKKTILPKNSIVTYQIKKGSHVVSFRSPVELKDETMQQIASEIDLIFQQSWHLGSDLTIDLTPRFRYNVPNNLSGKGIQYFVGHSWTNLKGLNLQDHNLGTKGCQYLQQMNLSCLENLHLAKNKIEEQGVLFLSQAVLKQLRTLSLSNNKIRNKGCKYLIQGEWERLQTIYINGCEIGQKGCRYLSKSKWKNLKKLKLSDYFTIKDLNCICSNAFKDLTRGEWNELKILSIESNWKRVQEIGCIHLSKISWNAEKSQKQVNWNYNSSLFAVEQNPKLLISFQHSRIEDAGFRYLKQCNFSVKFFQSL